MTDTDRYLNAATRGLWGRRRHDLRTELQGHIRVRMDDLILRGHTPADAERLTLYELGAPTRVSQGMLRLHTLPTVMTAGFATLLTATALLSAVQHAQAQVQSIYGNIPDYGATGYLNYEQLKGELQKAGLGLSGEGDDLQVSVPDAPNPRMPVHTWKGSFLQRDGQRYLRTGDLVSALMNTGSTLELSGWNNPTLRVGTRTLHLSTADWRVLNDLYAIALTSAATDLTTFGTLPLKSLEPNGNTGNLTVKNPLIRPGHVYALITAQFSDWYTVDSAGNRLDGGGTIMLVSNVVQGGSGEAQFRVYNDTRPLHLVGDMEAFQHALDPYRTKGGHWSAQHPAPALLLELTGKFGEGAYTVIPAVQAR